MTFRSLFFLTLLAATLPGQTTTSSTVRIKTTVGDIDVLLLPGSAPKTVENFLKYVNKKAYDNSVFHRSVRDFIVQTGGFQATLPNLPAITADPPVINEFRESNLRGTIAMAKLGNDPNSATNQWFFNLSNENASILNGQNGGFTVFGRIVDSASLAVMDRLAAVPVPSPGPLPSPFNEIPLQNYTGTLTTANLIVVNSITAVPTAPAPTISENGIQTAGAFGAYRVAAPGSYLEIYGANLAESTRAWEASDFVNNIAPTSLDGVSVTVGGQRAFVNFVSPTQVNVQVPATVSLNAALSVVLTYRGQATGAGTIGVRLLAGGLLAPASFQVGGKQFVYAVKASNRMPVSNGSIAGVADAPAVPGETLLFYGLGFGAMSPFSIPVAGQIVQTLGTLAYPVTFKMGGIDALVAFQGLIPGLVGLYQFNVVVPPDAPSGDLALELTQNNHAIAQTLFLPVRR